MYSSDAAPRRSKRGAPRTASSSAIQPTPTPRVRRPSDRVSRVASILAASTGGRCINTITEVSSRMRSVAAAAHVNAVICSRHRPVSLAGQVPSSL